MEETRYGLRVALPVGYPEAAERATAALKAEGFGVLTSIDVRDTLKKKLDVEFRPYTILGACNPPLAHRALQAEIDVGLLLPCNVVVYETGPGASVVAAVAPLSMIAMASGNADLEGVAREADAKLRRALAALESGSQPPG